MAVGTAHAFPLGVVSVIRSFTNRTELPVPLRETVCGLFAALSETKSVPLRLPLAMGMKVTEIWQLAPTPSTLPHELVCEKSPLMLMSEMLTKVFPVLVRVTVCGELLVPNVWFDNHTQGTYWQR